MQKNKIDSVLVAVDFSTPSKTAVSRARRFAKKFQAPLYFVHVFYDPFVSETRLPDIIESLRQFHARRVRSFYKLTAREKVFVECGSAAENIMRVAGSLPAPLIVAAHRGAGGVSATLLGSTAESLVLNSKVPVWIERGRGGRGMRRGLMPTDLHDRAAHTQEVVRGMGLADRQHELFHVVSPPMPVLDYHLWEQVASEIERVNEKALDQFKKQNPGLKVSEKWGDVTAEITRHAKPFDFIAISPRQKKGFFKSFGSVTAKLVRKSPIPLLVIP